MDMQMRHGLASGGAVIDANVETIWRELPNGCEARFVE